MVHNPHLPFLKILTAIVAALLATVVGYLLVYWWVFGNFNQALDVSVLKNQIVSQQNANDVQAQLEDLGYSVGDDKFFQLSNPNTVNYRADALGGYQPVRVEEPPAEDSYYFYDENGQAFFFVVGDDNKIDPESFVPLIQE